VADLAEEYPKAKRLREKGRCDNYIIMTNAAVSAIAEEAVVENLQTLGISNVLVFGREWIGCGYFGTTAQTTGYKRR